MKSKEFRGRKPNIMRNAECEVKLQVANGKWQVSER